jgi:3-hydroxy-9,10-secoandrosta-1,3,5(10)-triene-9,17-dione monooxygenase reductase component
MLQRAVNGTDTGIGTSTSTVSGSAARPPGRHAAPDGAAAAGRVRPADFRSVLGNFASGVTVITALDGRAPAGFTCQAFTSLSLEPPMISFAVARESGTRPRILAAGRFCVNVLAFDQHSLCQRFASRSADRFEGVEWWRSPGGSPVLDGVLAWIDCTVEAEYPAGDHTIVVGNVRELACQRTAAPLVFHRGEFASCYPVSGPGQGMLPRVG